jgi:hypothetical protein
VLAGRCRFPLFQLSETDPVICPSQEDLSGPYPGYGFGAMDQYEGYVVYRLLDPAGSQLAAETADMARLIARSFQTDDISQDLGLGACGNKARRL